MKVSKEIAKRLNRNIYIEKDRIMLSRTKSRQRFPAGSIVYVQKVRLAPKRHLLMGCVDSKVATFKKDFPKLVPYIKFKKSFAKTVSKGLAEAKKLVEIEPCLVKDFQIMVDAKGNIYHLDFDRCFRSSRAKWRMSKEVTRSCMKALDKMDRDIQGTLGYNNQ